MTVFEIDDLLASMANSEIRNFTPQYICDKLRSSDLSFVADYLLTLVPTKLTSYFDIICPHGDIDFFVHDLSELPSESIQCSHCNTEYDPQESPAILYFCFSTEYTEHIKKNFSVSNASVEL